MLRFFFCFFLLNNVYGNEGRPHLHAGHSTLSTSDKLTLRQFEAGFQSSRREMVYPYPNEEKESWDYGFLVRHSNGSALTSRFEENKFQAMLARKFSPHFLLRAKSWLSSLKNKSNQDSLDSLFYSLQGEVSFPQVYSSLEFEYDNSIEDLFYPKAIDNFLKKRSLNSTTLWMIKKFRFTLRDQYIFFSDGNRRNYTDLDLKYNFSFDKYWLLLGVGGEYYWTKNDRVGYWTPRNFLSFGLRAEATIPIGKSWMTFIGGNLSRFISETGAYGTGYYTNCGLQFGKRESSNLRIGYERVESAQNRSTWFMDRIYFSYNYFL